MESHDNSLETARKILSKTYGSGESDLIISLIGHEKEKLKVVSEIAPKLSRIVKISGELHDAKDDSKLRALLEFPDTLSDHQDIYNLGASMEKHGPNRIAEIVKKFPEAHQGPLVSILANTNDNITDIRKYSDKIIVHGEKLKDQMIEEYNIPKKKVNAIPIGEHEVAPFKMYEIKDLKENGNLILFFGRIWGYKGLEYLIKAEPMITKEVPDAKIVIAGTGEEFQKYKNMMMNRANFIVHNYRIPYKEGAELFQRCSLVTLPYIEASQSGVIPTAYGFKKPVVVTNVGSIPEIVDDEITGFIVPPKNPEALAEAIVKLLKDDKLRKQMGENAYKKLKTDLSWDKIAEKTIEVYKKAIRDRSCK